MVLPAGIGTAGNIDTKIAQQGEIEATWQEIFVDNRYHYLGEADSCGAGVGTGTGDNLSSHPG